MMDKQTEQKTYNLTYKWVNHTLQYKKTGYNKYRSSDLWCLSNATANIKENVRTVPLLFQYS